MRFKTEVRVVHTILLAGLTVGMLAEPAAAQQNIFYVDQAVQGGNDDGTSWPNAWDDLQEALAYAFQNPGYVDAIWVADGAYKPTTGSDRTVSFELVSGEMIYGGFLGNETGGYEDDLADRDIAGNPPTILSGDIGIEDDPADNSLHVVWSEDDNANTWISGFTIRDGNADDLAGTGVDDGTEGGGMHVACSDTAIINCTFIDNNAGWVDLDPEPCTIPGSAEGVGGAVFITGLELTGNCHSEVAIYNCDFNGNTVQGLDAVHVAGGGALWNNGIVEIVNSLFYGNEAIGRSVTVPCGNPPQYTTYDYVTHGGAVYNIGTATLVNCTIAHNTALGGEEYDGFGGGIFTRGNDLVSWPGDVTVRNCIVWDNEDSDGIVLAAQVREFNDDASSTIDHSDVTGIPQTNGNINVDPLFVDLANGNYRLRPASLCVDAGLDSTINGYVDTYDVDDDGVTTAETTPDLDRKERIVEDDVEMGAYEFACYADLTGDGVVDIFDLLALLGETWGACPTPCPPYCYGDINEDCSIDVLDLLMLLAQWGCGTPNPEAPPQDVQDCIDKYSDDIEQMLGCIEAILLTEE